MKFLNKYTYVLCGLNPIDRNDHFSENKAIELALPYNFSEKAKACWDYLDGTAYIFEYKNRLVVTDESLDLTEYGDGKTLPLGCPRWICDSWEELERILELSYDDMLEE